MSFQGRIALLSGVAVAVAFVVASALAYVAFGHELDRQLDNSLRSRATQLQAATRRSRQQAVAVPEAAQSRRPQDFEFYGQRVDRDGRVDRRGASSVLPVDDRTRAVAAGKAGPFVTDARVDGDDVRLLTTPTPGGGALQVGRSLAQTRAALDRIRVILLVVAAAGVAAAALLGRLVARRAIAPLQRLTTTAEQIAQTVDLTQRIDVARADEIGRLATRFNAMLDTLAATVTALDASLAAQRQLVADASHELRTPITSLRTNLETLMAHPAIDDELRAQRLGRAIAQTGELTALMNGLIDLARGDQLDEEREPVRLDELVEEALERAARHAPGQRFDVDLAETVVAGSPGRLMRAVNNLIDNAVRWNAPGAVIDVRLRDGELTVGDHGPGFDPAELDHVFDRFSRGADARAHSGSGLGLAIVRQIARAHGGTVQARNGADGGAILTLRLPIDPPSPA